MEMMGKIRRMYFRDQLSLHEITKRTGFVDLAQHQQKKGFRPFFVVSLFTQCSAYPIVTIEIEDITIRFPIALPGGL